MSVRRATPPRRYLFRRPSLWNILFLVALIVMILPVVGFYFLGIYQSALVRQTERQLIATGDVIAAQYRATLTLTAAEFSYREVCGAIGSEAYQNAIARGDRVLCFGQPAAEAYAPIYDTRGELIINRQAVLDLAIDPILPVEPDPITVGRQPRLAVQAAGQALQQTVEDTRAYTLASVRVLDQTGQIVASSNPFWLEDSLEMVPEVRRALEGEPVSVLRAKKAETPAPPIIRWFRAQPYRVNVAIPIAYEERVLGVVYLGRTPNSIRVVLWNKWPALAAGIGVLLLIVVILTFGASFLLVRPIRQLVRQSEDAAKGVKGAVTLLRRPGVQELASLSSALSTMAHRLEERAAYIESFAAQVSHEFKTPLTSIQGAIELLSEHGQDMSEKEKAKFLDNVASDSKRLELLVNRLLELARADTMETQGSERADLRATLSVARSRSKDREQPVRVSYDFKGSDPIWVAMGPDTLASVVLNMLDNAYQHAGSKTQVLVKVSRQPGAVRMEVADKGPGISASNSAQIFDPFFTTARGEGGTGLGLSLVRSLLQSSGGSIALTPAPKGYATAFALLITYASLAGAKA